MQRGEPRYLGRWALAATAATASFIAITVWWLLRDHGVPFRDAASHLYTATDYRELLQHGDVDGLLTRSGAYPPVAFIVAAFSMVIGGFNPDVVITGENLVFVSLLAVGCYYTGRLCAGPQAGFLAVIFALGSPLIIEQFHVFMLDAPQAAMVSVSVALILLSDRFTRVGISALAGLAVGVGMGSKEQYVIFVVGLLIAVIMRGQGWKNWRGLLVFAGVALVVASPWYVRNLSHLAEFASLGGGASDNLPARARPDLFSLSNLGWYFWAVLNGLFFGPLTLFASVGTVYAAWKVLHNPKRGARSLSYPIPELIIGLVVAWTGLSLTPHHDMRYTMSFVVYLAVLGTFWIPSLRRAARLVVVGILGAAVVATTAGATFGVGGAWRLRLGSNVRTDRRVGIVAPDQIVMYSDRDFNVGGPRSGDVLGLFKAMRRDGVRGVGWDVHQSPSGEPVFEYQGVIILAGFADLAVNEPSTMRPWRPGAPSANVIRAKNYHNIPPCVSLSDGTRLWATRNGGGRDGRYCPN